jgi:hypothetical protein
MPVYSLTYVSSAVTSFSKDDLAALLNQCARDNKLVGITGMLLYKDGNFMQALEGPEDNVRHVHGKITADSRHRGLITLLQSPIDERQFPNWSMSFRDLTGFKPVGNGAYNEFLNTPLTGEEFSGNPSRAQKLLTMFKLKM